jgi:uncharacterized membrane protein YtjA (UPF0391 family)
VGNKLAVGGTFFGANRLRRLAWHVLSLGYASHATCLAGLAVFVAERNGFPIREEDTAMLYWTLMFLIIAMIAFAMGFGVIGGMAYTAAKIVFFVFLVLFIASLFTGAVRRPLP